jgi:UDP-N-acetylmuramoyl-tripeptide--D-alanyl-D-alanine ligase
MRELGTSSSELHRDCGRHVASLKKIDWIFGVQGEAREFVDAAVGAGHPKNRTQFFENSSEAAKSLTEFVKSGDLLLLKGSRGVRMEAILEGIEMKHHRISSKHAGQALEAGKKGRD